MWRLRFGPTLHFVRSLDGPIAEIKSRGLHRIRSLSGDGLFLGHPPKVPCRANGDYAGEADQGNSPTPQEKMSPPMTVVFIEARRASGDMINGVFSIRP
jgi:hypothetical protein